MTQLTGSTEFVVADDVVACEISSGSAVLNLTTSRYFSLNSTASVLWEAIEKEDGKSMTVDALCNVLVERYDITPQDCYTDVVEVFTQFAKAGLVRIRNS